MKLESKGVIIEILRSCIPCRVHKNEGLMFKSFDSFEVRDAFFIKINLIVCIRKDAFCVKLPEKDLEHI